MSNDIPSEAWFISFGIPRLFNILDYDHETDQYQIQAPSHFGSQWRKKDSAMTMKEVDLWLFENSAMNQIENLVKRLRKVGIEIKISSNIPWIYLDEVNGKAVTEKFHSEHKFTIAFLTNSGEYSFPDLGIIFKTIRKNLTV